MDAILEQPDLVARRRSRLSQRCIHAGQVEVAGTALGQRERLQKYQRDSDEQMHPTVVGLGESLQDDFRRKIAAVCCSTASKGEESEVAGQRHVHAQPLCVQEFIQEALGNSRGEARANDGLHAAREGPSLSQQKRRAEA
jgi:hypothetical protein